MDFNTRLLWSGGAVPLVICSDCYDNANIYSRTRDYCSYAYLGEDDPLDKTLPGLKESFSEHPQHEDPALESLITNRDSSIFLTSHDKRLSSHTPPEHYANGKPVKQILQFYVFFFFIEQSSKTILFVFVQSIISHMLRGALKQVYFYLSFFIYI